MEEGNSQEENSVEKNSEKSKEREIGGDRSRKEGADRKLGICSAKAIGAGRFVENEEEQYPLLWECCGLKEEETLHQLFACPDGEKVGCKKFGEAVCRVCQTLSETFRKNLYSYAPGGYKCRNVCGQCGGGGLLAGSSV